MKKLFGLFLVTVSAPVFTLMYYSGLFLNKNETVVKEVENETAKLVSANFESTESPEVTEQTEETTAPKSHPKEEGKNKWQNTAHSTTEDIKAKAQKQNKQTNTAPSNVQEDNYRPDNYPRK